jgi:cytochrome c peroxidase
MLLRRMTPAIVLCAVLAAGCDESLETVAGPTPTLEPTFSAIQRDIFRAADSSGRPACANCHNPNGGGFRGTGLDMSAEGTYASLVGVRSTQKPGLLRVAPGDPANSYLIQKLEGRADITGNRMPTRGPYLTDGQIAIIKRWIELGAKRD